jgi:hypothetical protein
LEKQNMRVYFLSIRDCNSTSGVYENNENSNAILHRLGIRLVNYLDDILMGYIFHNVVRVIPP